MNVVIIQCRLGSTRLPSKALLPLGSQTCIEWTLCAMKKLECDEFYLATDISSYKTLAPIAQKHLWKCFAGSENDVLDRFCSLIRLIEQEQGKKVSWIVRATGDNPFIFYEAAQGLLQEVLQMEASNNQYDYCTYTGLPHGSGVEILNAQSLLKSQTLTSDPYDTEHVGPALYNHTDTWNCAFLPSPPQWAHPELRTTIDTYADYRRALRIADFITPADTMNISIEPYTAAQIIYALSQSHIRHPVLCIPQTKPGFGTGHAKRMIALASKLSADLYIPPDCSQSVRALIDDALNSNELFDTQIISNLESFQRRKSYSLVAADFFSMKEEDALLFSSLGPVVSIDDGSSHTDSMQYLIEIIPSLEQKRVNHKNIRLLDVPKREKFVPVSDSFYNKNQAKILVCLGGEDPAKLSYKASLLSAKAAVEIFPSFSIDVITTVPDLYSTNLQNEAPELSSSINYRKPILQLSRKLHEYDLVITHYGLTAFETVSLGIPLILLETTTLHRILAKKYGFSYISNKNLSVKSFIRALKKPERLKTLHPDFAPLYNAGPEDEENLPDLIRSLSEGSEHYCPLCGKRDSIDSVIERAENKTIRRCRNCTMLYPSWTSGGALAYTKSYFFTEYKKQYGKTYLEDFEQIKQMGIVRVHTIKKILNTSVKRTILDVGCAYGPFLSAAKDAGFIPYGTDISSDAISYVRDELKIQSCTAQYPKIDIKKEFNLTKFDAVTMWFVIEHFQNLHDVLVKTHDILTDQGVFAFSTPNACGVSRTFSEKKFFTQSPLDHFTLWELKNCKKILHNNGFKVKKIVCTGHHSERFPIIQKTGAKKGSLLFSLCTVISKMFSLGDTFEVYCIKIPNKL